MSGNYHQALSVSMVIWSSAIQRRTTQGLEDVSMLLLLFFFVCVCVWHRPKVLLVSFHFFLGELEKQQGAKTHSIKNNGTQLELRGRQGSPSGTLQKNTLRHTFICCMSYDLHSTSVYTLSSRFYRIVLYSKCTKFEWSLEVYNLQFKEKWNRKEHRCPETHF